MEKNKFYKLLKKIPKAEIHIHCEGIISKNLAQKLLSRINPDYKDKKKFLNLFNYNNLTEFIKTFLLIQNSFKKLSDFSELFNDIHKYLKRNGILYAELFFSPSLFVQNGWNIEEILNKFLKKLKKIKRKDNIVIKLIIDVSRTFGIENAMNNLNSIIKLNNKNIVGIGLGGDEIKGPARNFTEVFKKAKNYNFHRVAHAGEDDDSKSIWDAIKLLEAERIGHGISAIYDEKLMEYLKQNKIPLEISPTSNIFTKKYVKKIEDHPIKPFYEKGIITSLNTDDPTFFNIELIDEYWNLYTKLNFSLEDIKQIIIYGFQATFLDEKTKKKYINKVNKKWKKCFN